jgi:16S rRNA G966 N2-methylase RsmD
MITTQKDSMLNKDRRDKIRKLWFNLLREFRGNPLNFNFKQAVLACLREKHSNVYTHLIHPYPAKMFPYIPTFFFSIPEICPPDGMVLDPFCGSGTVLLESLIHPMYKRNAYGVEINPLGRLIAKVKTTPLEEDMLEKRINHLLELIKKSDDIGYISPESDKIKFWFSKRAIQDLSKLKYLIEEEGRNDDYKDFFWVCFSSIIRKVSRADPFIPPPVLLNVHKYRNSPDKYKFLLKFLKRAENPGVIGLFKNAVERNFERIKSLNKVDEVKNGEIKAQLIWDDVRHIKLGKLGHKGELIKSYAKILPSNSIDLVLTSPPYLTAQKYIRTQSLELLWLGMVSENEISRLEKEIIGSERVSLKERNFGDGIGVKSIDNLIRWASSISPQRAAMVFKYFFEMNKAISEIHRVLKSEAYAILVVGNNKVLGRSIETYKLLIDLAVFSGFKTKLVLKDKIRGRGMITKRHNSGGLIKEEFIIVLKKEG